MGEINLTGIFLKAFSAATSQEREKIITLCQKFAREQPETELGKSAIEFLKIIE